MDSRLEKTVFVEKEQQLRSLLGIPGEAKTVMILAESSHWDPNWLYTSVEYYTRFVEHNLLEAIAELERESRRIYSVECMFFLRMFWDKHPELQEVIRSLVNSGRLRLTSSGVTSADTLLPSAEALLRDLLLGQEWLRKNGMLPEPVLAYYPDCFGHTPGLPALLNAAGFKMTAFSRLDGMYMIATDFDPKSSFPRPGSSAELLQNVEKTLDFIWRGPDGSQVLAHWNAFTYFQGDMIAHRGMARAYLLPRFLAYPDRSDRLVRQRIQGYATQLAALSRTPYLFCPIGMDFNPPIPGLLDLIDRYNQRHYLESGLWVVNAGLDDYLELVDCYRDKLPVLELDPNPYWTGFYTSRPSLKKRCYDLIDKLLLVEALSAIEATASHMDAFDLESAWWALATSNHHDFITGTSPDPVVEGEQIPMLEEALRQVDSVLENRLPVRHAKQAEAVVDSNGNPPQWERRGDKIIVRTSSYELELDEVAGGCLTRLRNLATGQNLLQGVSSELVDYLESGGLWRMGLEYKGGKFQPLEHSSHQQVHLDVQAYLGALEISSSVSLGGSSYQQAILCQNDTPWISFRLIGRAAEKHTLGWRFQCGLQASQASMENPGGVIGRPVKKIYEPTFWPVQHFYHLQDHETGRGAAFLLAVPGAVAYRPVEQVVELVALRNATREKVYGLINIPACPAEGHEKSESTFQFGLYFTESGGWRENRLPQLARQYARRPWLETAENKLRNQIIQEVMLSSPEVWLEALKPAWRGEGLIARLCAFDTPSEPVRFGLRGLKIREAFKCDARERDQSPLKIVDNQVEFMQERAITTLRIII
jgi:alpha-mannosidase